VGRPPHAFEGEQPETNVIKLTSRIPQASSWIYWEGRKGSRNGKGIEKGEKAERERKGEGRERKGDRPHGDFQ